MPDSRDIRDYLHDILHDIENARKFTANMSLPEFQADEKTIYAVAKCLENIGEAVKRLPDDIRAKYKIIPWREIAGMRDILSHEYFQVEVAEMWVTVQNDLQPLEDAVKQILSET